GTLVALLQKKPLESQDLPVLLDPRVAVQLLSLLSSALSAESVQNGRSFLTGKMGETVLSREVTIVDDPRVPNRFSFSDVDDEGAETNRLTLFERGALQSYFYDGRTARKDNRTSNGRGFRPSYRSRPTPSPTHLFVEPGPSPIQDAVSAEPIVF